MARKGRVKDLLTIVLAALAMRSSFLYDDAMLLDIGIGILAALGLHQPIWLGILFALLPDADALLNFLRYRSTKLAYKHRDLLHLPLLYFSRSNGWTSAASSASRSASWRWRSTASS